MTLISHNANVFTIFNSKAYLISLHEYKLINCSFFTKPQKKLLPVITKITTTLQLLEWWISELSPLLKKLVNPKISHRRKDR